jgi:hypothetical protein
MRIRTFAISALLAAAMACSASTSSPNGLDAGTDGGGGALTACERAGGHCGGACGPGFVEDHGSLSCPPSNPLSGAANAACCLPSGDDGGTKGDAASDGGKPAPILASDYSQACVHDEDCVLASVSDDVCNPCGDYCISSAIAKSEAVRYANDVAERKALCPPPAPQPECPAIANCNSKAFCDGGRCSACIEGAGGSNQCPHDGGAG